MMEKDTADKLLEYLRQGLTNDEIIERLDFYVEYMKLSKEEADEFITFVRTQRAKKHPFG